MEARSVVRVVARNWPVVALVTLAGLASAGVITLATPPTYVASSGIIVGPRNVDSLTDLSQSSAFTQDAVKNFANIATRGIVLAPAAKRLDPPTTADELSRRVTAAAPIGTSIVTITASAGTSTEAAAEANAVAASLISVADDLSPSSLISVQLIESAAPPAGPSSPHVKVNLVLGVLVGLALSALAVYLIEKLNNRVRTRDDLTDLVAQPLIGEILFDRTAWRNPLVVRDEPSSGRAEAFRALRTNLQFLRLDKNGRSFVITSSTVNEGKTTTCANLAIALADAGEQVLVIDADLREPRISEYFGLDGNPGLTDVLIGQVDVESAVTRWGDGSISVLPAGSEPPNPSELLQSRDMHDLLTRLREQYSVVLLDTPPLLAVTDAAVLAKRTSGALLVCAAGRTKRSDLVSAVDTLQRVDARALGIVLTMTDSKTPAVNGYGTRSRRNAARPGSPRAPITLTREQAN